MKTEAIGRETHLRKDLFYDSLDDFSAILGLESMFDISISYEDADKILKDPAIGAVIDYVEGVLAGKPQEV